MTVTASVTDNVQLISASILDAVQQVMDDNVIIGSLNLVSVKKLVFLGDTMEQAKAGSTSSGGPIPLPPAGGGGGGNSSSEANKTPNAPVNTALAVGIPVALLMPMPLTQSQHFSFCFSTTTALEAREALQGCQPQVQY